MRMRWGKKTRTTMDCSSTATISTTTMAVAVRLHDHLPPPPCPLALFHPPIPQVLSPPGSSHPRRLRTEAPLPIGTGLYLPASQAPRTLPATATTPTPAINVLLQLSSLLIRIIRSPCLHPRPPESSSRRPQEDSALCPGQALPRSHDRTDQCKTFCSII